MVPGQLQPQLLLDQCLTEESRNSGLRSPSKIGILSQPTYPFQYKQSITKQGLTCGPLQIRGQTSRIWTRMATFVEADISVERRKVARILLTLFSQENNNAK
ncbi:hypothetical protein GRJ2_000296300 [Grus japonensis]|uniref:Uncharacterized protein n=1 Tax=Grus japonensis TaxID=30415 RepID=A0ABC9VYH4_GRUJA